MDFEKNKIFVIYSGRYPSEKAHSFFVSKVCESFGDKVNGVILVTSKRDTQIKEDPFCYFGVKKNFTIKRLPVIDFFSYSFIFERIFFYLTVASFGISCFFYILFKTKKNDIVYSNELFSLLPLIFIKRRVYYELHDYPEKWQFVYKYFFKKINGVIITNRWKYNKLKEEFDLDEKNILYVPNAVDLKKFDATFLKGDFKKKYKLPENKKIISYIGKYKTMGMEKGVGDIIRSFSAIINNRSDIFLLIVGVNEDEYNEIEKLFKENKITTENYKIVFHVPQSEVIGFMKASDILVMNYPENKHYSYYMSPMKMFEYMASGAPIVATKLPSIIEILNINNAILVNPGDEEDLKNGIMKLLENSELRKQISIKARQDVEEYTWEKRADKIINFIKYGGL